MKIKVSLIALLRHSKIGVRCSIFQKDTCGNILRMRAHAKATILLTVLLATSLYAKDAHQHRQVYLNLLKQQKTAKLVQTAQAVYKDRDTNRWDALSAVIAENVSLSRPVLESLAQDKSIPGITCYAELLLRCARGVELASWHRTGKDLDELSLDEIGQRAIALMDHPDPFVRALADWAVNVRVGMVNGGRTRVWPQGDGPAWFRNWQRRLTPAFKLNADYTRQCVVLNQHRNCQDLWDSAREIQTRLERMTGVRHLQSLLQAMRENQDLTQQRKLWLQCRRAARKLILAQAKQDCPQILFATRHAYHDGPNITAGAKSYIIKPGGDIWMKAGFNPGDPIRPLIDGQLDSGHSRGIELNWDAERVLFAYTEQPEYFKGVMWESDQGFDDKEHGLSRPVHLYEINVDGSGLRQLTDHPYYSDVEPAYLPNGDIVFCSERSGYGSQCSGHFFQNKRIVNLFACDAHGRNIRAISNNKDFDRHAHVLDTGQVIFTRWEYQERHLWQVHNVWVRHPDGMMSDPIFKEHINSGPMALRDTRHIPDSHKLISIACGHHEFAQGAVALLDPHMGTNDPAGMHLVTPRISPREGGLGRGKTVPQGGVSDRGGLYQQPYALSETAFLVSYSYHLPREDRNAHNFNLYYIDVWGHKELIHREPILSSVYPIPCKTRPRPMEIQPKLKPEQDYALVYMNDVTSGAPEIAPGEVKYLRIAHHTEWPTEQTGESVVEFNHLHYTPSGSWSRTLGLWTWTPARVIGEVPVEADGSAYFKVPANVPLYFQALDQDRLEVRRMRSFITFQPGEIRGCTGCHETRDQAPLKIQRVARAAQREPSMPMPPSWGASVLPDFEEHIQPILSKHCTDCHGPDDPAGGLEFSQRKIEGQYQSYRTLFGLAASDKTPVQEGWSHKLINPENPEPKLDRDALKAMEKNQYPNQLVTISNRFGDNSVSQVREFGSKNSRLTLTLVNDPEHREAVQMSEQEWIDLVTWVDLNVPYWGSFVDKEPLRKDQAPRRIKVKFPEPFLSAVNK